MKNLATTILLLIAIESSNAQIGSLEDILGVPTEAISEDMYESLLQNYQNPLDLNTLTFEQLTLLGILSERQLNAFFSYRSLIGSFESIYELQVIPDFDLPTIYRLLPFVYLPNKASSLGQDMQQAKHWLILRYGQYIEQKKGFTPPDTRSKVRYEGTPFRTLLRYKWYHTKNLQVGFTLEKDEGEQYITDFQSFHIQIQNKGILKNLTLGDFTLQVGQGLVSGAGFYLGKSSESVLFTRRSDLGIRAHTSSLEMNFFRGIASSFQWGKLQATGFFSSTLRDANVVSSTSESSSWVSSLQTSGLHRTTSEIADKHSQGEQNIGYGMAYYWAEKKIKIGVFGLHTHYQLPLLKADKLYNQYEFSGNDNLLLSLNYAFAFKNNHFFGEIARSSSGGIGMVAGIISSLNARLDMSLLFRKYDPNFHSFYSNSFAENSRSINETGLYYGLKYTFNRQWQLSSYFDYFYFPWYKYLVDKPQTNGFEYLIRAAYQPQKTTKITAQLRLENKEENVNIQQQYEEKGKIKTKNITEVRHRTRAIFSTYLSHKINYHLALQSRISMSTYQFEGLNSTHGIALSQDAKWDFGKLALALRIAYFNTQDYDNRQYMYEQDMMYAFSLPAYNGVGWRHYALISYQINKNLTAWIRWARTDLTNATSFGSGLDEINAPHRSEIKVQLRVQF